MFGVDDAIVAGVGGSLLTGLLNNSAASARQDDAQRFSGQQFATRYQTTVADMQAAGLSPMLAYSQGAGGAPSSSAASSAGTPDLGQAFNQARMASAQVANVEADTSNKAAQADLMRAQTAQATSSSWESQARTELTTNQSREIVQRLQQDLPAKQAEQIAALTADALGRYQLAIKQGLTEDQRKFQIEFLAGKISKEIQALDLSMPELQAVSKFFSSDIGSNSPMARFLMEMGEGVSGLILPWKKFGNSSRPSQTNRVRTYDPDSGISTESTTHWPVTPR